MSLTKAQLKFANEEYARKFAKSHVKDNTNEFPRFEKSELGMGKLLGKGGFGTVMEIRSFTIANTSLKKNVKDDDEAGGMENKKFIAEHCLRKGGDSKGDARYAIKYLSPETAKDPALLVQGVMDLAIEVRFLSDIEHPNIVKMRALSDVDSYHQGFFILMDRLYDTLEKRIEKWKKRHSGTIGLAGKLGDRKGTKAQDLMVERLVVAFDISSALAYLHGRKYVSCTSWYIVSPIDIMVNTCLQYTVLQNRVSRHQAGESRI
jgi:serine/threonine protein kinase